MENQGADRRAVLEMLAKAAAASQFPGFSRWAFGQQHEHAEGAPPPARAANHQPSYFSASEYQTIDSSNPDGEYLPPMNFRSFDRIPEGGSRKIGIPYLPDRIAPLTVAHAGHPSCHYFANCTEGCDVGAFFSTPWFFLPAAEKSGNPDLRTNALCKDTLVDENGRARGVAYVDRNTREEVEVYGKNVVPAASCVESPRSTELLREATWILLRQPLNSRKRHFIEGGYPRNADFHSV